VKKTNAVVYRGREAYSRDMIILSLMRGVLIVLWLLLVSIASLPIFILRPFSTQNAELFLRCFSPIACKILGIKVDADFFDPSTSGRIILCNHQDSLDLVIFGLIFPKNVVVIGKKQIIWIPFFGLCYWLAGQLFIDRSNIQKAKDTLDKAKEKLFKAKQNILIMPEGTRTRSKGLSSFKKGAFHLAMETKATILPIVVSSYYGKLNFRAWNAGTIRARFLPEIHPQKWVDWNTNQLRDHLHDLMAEKLRQLDTGSF
jgi:1-acyl-sn-glycerol-3-phosphate acyltransferase